MAAASGSRSPATRVRPAGRVPCLCPSCSTPFRPETQGRFRCPSCALVIDLWMTEAAVKDRRPETGALTVAAASEDHPACVLHPQNASTIACARCGDFICDVCRIGMEGRDFCPPCFEHGIDKAELRTVQRQFRQPQFALALGALSLPGGLCVSYFSALVGLLAVGMGIQALMRISRQPSLGGRGKAIAGIILGSVGFLVWVLLFVVVISSMTRGGRWD